MNYYNVEAIQSFMPICDLKLENQCCYVAFVGGRRGTARCTARTRTNKMADVHMRLVW